MFSLKAECRDKKIGLPGKPVKLLAFGSPVLNGNIRNRNSQGKHVERFFEVLGFSLTLAGRNGPSSTHGFHCRTVQCPYCCTLQSRIAAAPFSRA